MKQYEDPNRTNPPEDGNIYINLMLESFSDFERGEYDCIHGYEAQDGESAKYYKGFGKAYTLEANATARSEQ